jgi:oligoribonuclease
MPFVWVDTETTGLNGPQHDLLLAIGIILTDDSFRATARIERYIRPEDWDVMLGLMSPVVTDMHFRSGLMRRLELHGEKMSRVEGEICDWLDKHLGRTVDMPITERPALAGNTVGFDRAMLQGCMPRILERVSYRSLDVSSLKVLCYATAPRAARWDRGHPKQHTPLADLEDSLDELAHWRQALRTAP